MRVISPPSFETTISPDGLPSSSGNKIISDLPNSSTVVVKSVPLTAMDAVGVVISILALLTNPNLPEANLAVPIVNFILIFDNEGSGS